MSSSEITESQGMFIIAKNVGPIYTLPQRPRVCLPTLLARQQVMKLLHV